MNDVSAEALDAQIDQAHNVRSVLWAMATLLAKRADEGRPSQALLFELHQLTATGLRLADEFIESMQADR
jgi:hypothetical protein